MWRRPKAFLSCTSLDLQGWRPAISRVLSQAGLEVLAMDDFPALAQSAQGGSLAMVTRCRVLVGIYARRYGTLAPDGRSITEHEYSEATAKGLARLCFMLDEKADWPAALAEGEPGASALASFKSRIRSDVIVRTFEDLDDLLTAVSAAANEYLGKERRRRRRRFLLGTSTALMAALAIAMFVLSSAARPLLTSPVSVPNGPFSDINRIVADRAERRFVTGHWNGELVAWTTDLTRSHIVGRARGTIAALAIDSRTREIVVVSAPSNGPSEVSRWASNGEGQPSWRWRCETPSCAISCLAVAADGRFAVGDQEGTLRVFETGTAGQPRTVPPPSSPYGAAAGLMRDLDFSPDGSQIAAAFLNGTVAVLGNNDRWQMVGSTNPDVRGASAVAFVNNEVLAFGAQERGGDGTIFKLWTSDTVRGLRLLEVADNIHSSLISARDDRYLVSADWSGDLAIFDARDGTHAYRVSTGTFDSSDHLVLDTALLEPDHLLAAVTEKRLYRWTLQWRTLGGLDASWLRRLRRLE